MPEGVAGVLDRQPAVEPAPADVGDKVRHRSALHAAIHTHSDESAVADSEQEKRKPVQTTIYEFPQHPGITQLYERNILTEEEYNDAITKDSEHRTLKALLTEEGLLQDTNSFQEGHVDVQTLPVLPSASEYRQQGKSMQDFHNENHILRSGEHLPERLLVHVPSSKTLQNKLTLLI